MTTFAEKYAPKYDKAVDCLIKDRETLLTFFDFPADHWDHLRTTNPIESVFATVRHRTVRIPTKPATHSNRKPATDSDLKPAGVPI
jgi:transposase-like protein